MKTFTNPQPVRAVMRERIEVALRGECFLGCECTTAKLTLRTLRNGTKQVHIQCDVCGRSVGGALSKAEFPDPNILPPWDDDRPEAWLRGHHEAGRQALAARRNLLQNEWVERRRQYAAFCRTSSDWANLRNRVIARAGGVCEACLAAPAETAHHLSYECGKLPPAWLLRAVCRRCHDRIHADAHGMFDEWCAMARTMEDAC